MHLTERFPLMVSKQMMAEVDDFRHGQRIGARAEAVRRLILLGLAEWRMKATAGVEFGDMSPAAAENHNTKEECCDAANT